MFESLVFLLILLSGGMGVVSIFNGLRGWRKKGFRSIYGWNIVGGVLFATPLGLILGLAYWFTHHPFNIT